MWLDASQQLAVPLDADVVDSRNDAALFECCKGRRFGDDSRRGLLRSHPFSNMSDEEQALAS
jgi:hypothetical protein